MTPALPTETDYVRSLLSRAPAAFPDVYLFRRNVISMPMMHKGKHRYVRAAEAGQCDIYAIRDGGQHYEIECKRGTKLSEAQQRWRVWCEMRGISWTMLDVRKGELPAQTIERWVGELRGVFR